MSDFHFTRDFRNIRWKETIWYNGLRAFSAGLVFAVLTIIGGTGTTVDALMLFIFYPLMYFCILLPVGLVTS